MLKILSQLFIMMICFVLLTQQLLAETPSSSASSEELQNCKTEQKKKIALSEDDQALIYALRRYPKFYGDENMATGNIFERSYLLGSFWGARDKLAKNGIFLDVGITQFFASNVRGGKRQGNIRYNGTSDYWAMLDSGKANLWPGGLILLHGETSWQANKSVNSDTGNLLPPNFDAVMPLPNINTTTLSELYFTQAFPYHLIFFLGKVNYGGLADQNIFANNDRFQFIYMGLVNNPIAAAFIPYTPLGLAVVWTPNKKHTLAIMALDADGKVTKAGFDTVFNGNTTAGIQYQYSPSLFGKLPGDYRVLAGYSSKDLVNFDIDKRSLIEELIGTVPVAKKTENYSLSVNFDQYLWTKKESNETYQKRLNRSKYPGIGRHHLPPLGFGIFGRAGWAPKDRNVIDQFYSFGFGGFGLPRRDYDRWGIGYAATHISSDLRRDLDVLRINLHTFEHAFEIFYNFQITPAMHFTLNSQAIKSPLKSRDTAYTVGSRLQVDF